MKNFKKVLALILSLIMVLPFNMVAFADDGAKEYHYKYYNSNDEDFVSSSYAREDENAPTNTEKAYIAQNTENEKKHALCEFYWIDATAEEKANGIDYIEAFEPIEEPTDCTIDEENATTNTTEAKCTVEGKKTMAGNCSVCNQEMTVETITSEALGHTGGTATCIASAVCTRCSQPYGELAGHDWDEDFTVDIKATCTAQGSKSIHCKICTEKKDVTPIDIIDHQFTIEQSQTTANCVDEGSITYKCQNCDETNTVYGEIDATNHKSVVTDKAVSANCTEAGKTEGSHCSACDTVIVEQVEEEPLGHNYENYICSRCNDFDCIIQSVEVLGIDQFLYFLNEKWATTVTLNVKYKNHEEIVNVTPEESIKTLKGFSTSVKSKNMPVTFTYTNGQEGCEPVTISLQDKGIRCQEYSSIWLSVNNNAVVGVKLDKTTKGESTYVVKSNKITFDYQVVARNMNVTLSNDAKKVFTYTNVLSETNAWAEGKLTIQLKDDLSGVSSLKNCYIIATGEAYGKKYTYKLYIKVPKTFRIETKAITITNGSSVSKTLSLVETYIDDTIGKENINVTLSASTVGKNTKKVTINGKSVNYTYYVRLKAPTSVKATAGKKSATLTWKKVSGATGYQIYRKKSTDNSYKLVKTIKSGSTVKYVNKSLTSKKTYNYKIIAVHSNSKCNSTYSSVASCKVK